MATAVLLGFGLLAGGMGMLARGGAIPQAEIAASADDLLQAQEERAQPLKEAVQRLQGEKRAAPKVEGVPEADDPKAPPPAFGPERLQQLLKELLKTKKTDEQIVEALFLATVARLPTEKENQTALDHVAKVKAAAKERATAFEDLLGALLNSKEFVRHAQELNKSDVQQRLLDRLRLLPQVPREPQDPNAPGRGPFFN